MHETRQHTSTKETFIPPDKLDVGHVCCFICGYIRPGYEDLTICGEDEIPRSGRTPSFIGPDEVRYWGGYDSAQSVLPAKIENKEAGQRIQNMFKELGLRTCLLANQENPKQSLLVIGSCETHLPQLKNLSLVTSLTFNIDLQTIQRAVEE